MKLLLIEDNVPLADRVKNQLVGRRYLVDHVHTGEEALERVKELQYAGIILDLGLPGMSGNTVCKSLREDGIESPIMILTGFDKIKTRIELLDMGADDYLTKPFDSEELRARVAALVRRQPLPHSKPIITLGDVTIDIEQRQVLRQNQPISLRRKEFDILVYLIENNGRVLTREMIINYAWESFNSNWSSTVDVHIKHLRDKIDRPFDSKIIKTAYGLGYSVDIPNG